jgi:hypothetical protein
LISAGSPNPCAAGWPSASGAIIFPLAGWFGNLGPDRASRGRLPQHRLRAGGPAPLSPSQLRGAKR